MNPSFHSSLKDAQVRRACDTHAYAPQRCLASGFHALDAALAGGWPLGALTQILVPSVGIGEVSLLMPALAHLSSQRRWLAWIAPPSLPYAPALVAHGVALSHVLVVHPRDERAALGAVEQALRSGTCGAVLAWAKQADERSLRRLQAAAEEGQSTGFLFCAPSYSEVPPSPAALRVRVEPAAHGLSLQILKRRGGGPLGHVPIACDTNARIETPWQLRGM